MTPKISLTKTSSDEDMVVLHINVSDGFSSFVSTAYVGHKDLSDAVARLLKFQEHIYGGVFDLRFGEFGPEYASGAFHARLHCQDRGKIYVTVQLQYEFANFGQKNVASEATLYLVSEPALLDNFIHALAALSNGQRDHAALEAIYWN